MTVSRGVPQHIQISSHQSISFELSFNCAVKTTLVGNLQARALPPLPRTGEIERASRREVRICLVFAQAVCMGDPRTRQQSHLMLRARAFTSHQRELLFEACLRHLAQPVHIQAANGKRRGLSQIYIRGPSPAVLPKMAC